jgi:hypothetical protein
MRGVQGKPQAVCFAAAERVGGPREKDLEVAFQKYSSSQASECRRTAVRPARFENE